VTVCSNQGRAPHGRHGCHRQKQRAAHEEHELCDREARNALDVALDHGTLTNQVDARRITDLDARQLGFLEIASTSKLSLSINANGGFPASTASLSCTKTSLTKPATSAATWTTSTRTGPSRIHGASRS
jgi:hypothetical protein